MYVYRINILKYYSRCTIVYLVYFVYLVYWYKVFSTIRYYKHYGKITINKIESIM